MKKLISLSILALGISFSSFALTPITGPTGICVSATGYLSDTTSGGTWSSSNTAIATVGSSSGIIYGVSAGTCTITYTLGGSYVTETLTVAGTLPAPIAGTTSFCMGTSSTLSDATPGGTWSSSGWAATVGSLTGVVTGVTAGSVTIYYTVGSGCSQSAAVTITSTAPVLDSILGPSTVCTGSAITLTNSYSGGVWTSGTPSVATIGSSSGVVTGVAVGSADMTYTVSTGCGWSSTDYWVSVSSTTSSGTIYGTTSIDAGDAVTLGETAGGGTWTSATPSVATIGSSSGIVSGITAGTSTITYTVSGCSGTAYTTTGVTVSVVNRISGTVHFPGGGPFLSGTYDTLKIWLITYNPGTLMLEASDSITTLIDSAEDYYYQFLSEPADSYRVKAAVHMVTFTGTGYIPTYHTSSYYWHDADVFYHVTTSADDGEDINMAFGTTISGPGFISGNVSMGANKGTSVTIPAVGLLIFAINSSGTLIQQVYTDASGNYSFSSLPLGTYTIYPEEINYNTTAYTGITLTSSSSSMSGADFGQHTVSKTILPITSGIKNTPPAATSIITFPNPTAGKLNILWNETTNEKSNVTLTDITGRKIYSAVLNMNAGSGSSQIDLSGIENGIYMMTIESGTINYKNKLEIQQ